MSSKFINGAKYAFATVLGAAVPITALSNANPAVASSTTPGAVGDIVFLKSGWSEIDESVARISAIAAGVSATLEGVDTSNVSRFPAGEGIGSMQKASAFVSLSQTRNINSSGGEQQFFTFTYVEDPRSRQRQKPTFKNAQAMQFTLDYDPDLPWHAALKELDRLGEPTVMRETLRNGDVIYYTGYVSFNDIPSKTANENMTVQVTFSLLAEPIRYEAP